MKRIKIIRLDILLSYLLAALWTLLSLLFLIGFCKQPSLLPGLNLAGTVLSFAVGWILFSKGKHLARIDSTDELQRFTRYDLLLHLFILVFVTVVLIASGYQVFIGLHPVFAG